MITESIMNFFVNFANMMLNGLPTIAVEDIIGPIGTFMGYIDVAAYFVPMDTVVSILTIIIAEEMLKIGIAVVKFILKFVPFVG